MKRLIKYLLSTLAILFIGIIYYTHTDKYVEDHYDNFIQKECAISQSPPLCFFAMLFIKADAIKCMQSKLLSTSESTMISCMEKVTDTLVKGNK